MTSYLTLETDGRASRSGLGNTQEETQASPTARQLRARAVTKGQKQAPGGGPVIGHAFLAPFKVNSVRVGS
jgi:hypothetical protein